MPATLRQSPEAALGGGFAASGLLVLVVGSCLAGGTALIAVILVGLFLLALGVGVLMIALPPRQREQEPAQRAAETPLRACPPAKPQEAAEAAAPAPETQPDDEPGPEPPLAERSATAEPDEPHPGTTENSEGTSAPEKRRCSALTKSGAQCRMRTDDLSGLCHVHRG
jgi:predicted lipid-binding transport protein (Tim44 family)